MTIITDDLPFSHTCKSTAPPVNLTSYGPVPPRPISLDSRTRTRRKSRSLPSIRAKPPHPPAHSPRSYGRDTARAPHSSRDRARRHLHPHPQPRNARRFCEQSKRPSEPARNSRKHARASPILQFRRSRSPRLQDFHETSPSIQQSSSPSQRNSLSLQQLLPHSPAPLPHPAKAREALSLGEKVRSKP